MSDQVLIIGKSGSGKTRSILNLDPKRTFVISALKTQMSFMGWAKSYSKITKENPNGNFLCSDDYSSIGKWLLYVDQKRKGFNCIVIDDFQYLMANEFMRRSKEVGYTKFTEIAQKAWELINLTRKLRDDLVVVFLAHNEITETGESKCKTIGKMLDDKICLEGMFNIALNTAMDDGKYFFETQNNGHNTSKSPEGMFETLRIENDLKIVVESIQKYNKGG